MKLTRKVAVVTGASRGLGKAVAIELARNGAKVACVARDVEKLRETVGQITQAGGNAESSHRTSTALNLANIAIRMGRPIRFDPDAEQILGEGQRIGLHSSHDVAARLPDGPPRLLHSEADGVVRLTRRALIRAGLVSVAQVGPGLVHEFPQTPDDFRLG